MSDNYFYFGSPIYVLDLPDFLVSTTELAEEMLGEITDSLPELFPMKNTKNFANHPKVLEFNNFIAQKSRDVLREQGYAMDNFSMHVEDMWVQEHHKHSLMEQHVHGGAQIVGFYFLNAPDMGSRVLFHDPRPGKVQNFLPENNPNDATAASNVINFTAKPGQLIMSNAWVPHSFSRHGAEEALKFIHFNVYSVYSPPALESNAEII